MSILAHAYYTLSYSKRPLILSETRKCLEAYCCVQTSSCCFVSWFVYEFCYKEQKWAGGMLTGEFLHGEPAPRYFYFMSTKMLSHSFLHKLIRVRIILYLFLFLKVSFKGDFLLKHIIRSLQWSFFAANIFANSQNRCHLIGRELISLFTGMNSQL